MHKLNFLLIYIIICQIFFISCSKDPEKIFNDEIAIYRKERHSNLAVALLETVSLKFFSNSDSLKINESIYSQEKKKIVVIDPISRIVVMKDELNVQYCSNNENYTVLSDLNKLAVYDSTGNLKKELFIGESGKKVQSIYFNQNQVFYIYEFQLFNYDIEKDFKKVFIEDKFVPVFNKYYKTSFYHYGDLLGIISGMAGSYYLDIININTKSLILKKFPVSSSKLLVTNNELIYVKGGSGEWSIEKFNINNKTAVQLNSFNNIFDLEFFSSGLIYLDKNGLSINNYRNESVKIPFDFELKGRYLNFILLKFENRIYLINHDKLFEKLKYLKSILPDIF